jgi:hypothetical protein
VLAGLIELQPSTNCEDPPGLDFLIPAISNLNNEDEVGGELFDVRIDFN